MSGTSGGGTPVQIVLPRSAPGTTGTAVPPTRPQHQPASHLPFTGLDVLPMLLLAVALAALGVVLLLTGRLPRTVSRRT